MDSVFALLLFGALICAMGVVNMRGNLSTLHWYHRHRVTEENKKPFGKQVGLGTVIIGAALIAYGILQAVSVQIQLEWLIDAGTVMLVAAVVVGMIISFHAMIKYNKGIF